MNDILQLLSITIFTSLTIYAMSAWEKYWEQGNDD